MILDKKRTLKEIEKKNSIIVSAHFFLIILLFVYVHVWGGKRRCLWKPGNGPGAGIASSCETPSTGAGNQTWFQSQSSKPYVLRLLSTAPLTS